MAGDKRLEFINKWHNKAKKEIDPFDKFIYSWIALVVAAQRFRTYNGYISEDDTDREKIKGYFRAKIDFISEILGRHRETMQKLARRRGTTYGNFIVDTGNDELRKQFKKLAKHYNEKPSLTQKELVETVAELINKIRNNLFHGIKLYDDREDAALIELVNPILIDIVETCEFRASS